MLRAYEKNNLIGAGFVFSCFNKTAKLVSEAVVKNSEVRSRPYNQCSMPTILGRTGKASLRGGVWSHWASLPCGRHRSGSRCSFHRGRHTEKSDRWFPWVTSRRELVLVRIPGIDSTTFRAFLDGYQGFAVAARTDRDSWIESGGFVKLFVDVLITL